MQPQNRERYYPSPDPTDPTGKRVELTAPKIFEMPQVVDSLTRHHTVMPFRIIVPNTPVARVYCPSVAEPLKYDMSLMRPERLFAYKNVQAKRWISTRIRYIGKDSGEVCWRDTYQYPLNINDPEDLYIAGTFDKDEGFYHIVTWYTWCELDSAGEPIPPGMFDSAHNQNTGDLPSEISLAFLEEFGGRQPRSTRRTLRRTSVKIDNHIKHRGRFS